MSRLEDLFDGGHGKLGNLVFFKRHGKSYVRTKPASYKDRKSPKQLAQRQRLQVVNSFLRNFSVPLKVTFASEAVGRSALQAAHSFNMRNALAGEYPDIYVDRGRVQLSSGPLPLPEKASLSVQDEGLLIEWNNGEEASGNAKTDTLVVLALTKNADSSDYQFTGVKRSEGKYVWKPAFPVSADELPDVWIAFRNREMTGMSNSKWLG